MLTAATRQPTTALARLQGAMPQDADVLRDMSKYSTSPNYPIVLHTDFTKVAGDTVRVDNLDPLVGYPVMGGQYISGTGNAMTFSTDSLRIEVSRKAINLGTAMTQQRTIHQLRAIALEMAKSYFVGVQDQRAFVHMAGARGFHQGAEWNVPLASHPEFANIMVNPVAAPVNVRHYVANATTGLAKVAPVAGVMNLATTDVLNTNVLDALRGLIDSDHFTIPPVRFDGDPLAYDDPLRVLLVSPQQYTTFIQSGTGTNAVRTLIGASLERASSMNKHPLFLGGSLLWNGILIVKMPKAIRFYGADPIQYCADPATVVESTATVPAAFTAANFAVDRAILLGGNALAHAVGKLKLQSTIAEEDILGKLSIMVTEEVTDHMMRNEIAVTSLDGYKKMRFLQNIGNNQSRWIENCIVIDTAVPVVAGV
jgi:N4-gp56 family major capsid protein